MPLELFPFIAPLNPGPNQKYCESCGLILNKRDQRRKISCYKAWKQGQAILVVNIFWFFQKSSRRLSCWCQLTLRSRPLQKGTATSLAWTINGVALLRNKPGHVFFLSSLLYNVLYCMLFIVLYWGCVFGQAVLPLQRVIDFFFKNSEVSSAAACTP